MSFLSALIFFFNGNSITGFSVGDEEAVGGVLEDPTHDIPVLNSTIGYNLTTENLTVYNQSTADGDSDLVKNVVSWVNNTFSFESLVMSFEGDTNSTNAKDYSNYRNNGTVIDAVWMSTSGFDGFGAYMFNSSGENYINVSDSNFLDFDSFGTIDFWVNVSSNAAGTIGVIGKGDPSQSNTSNYLILADTVGGLYNVMSSSYGDSVEMSSAQVITDSWQHITVRFNNSFVYFFQNGSLTNRTGFNLGGTNDHPFVIGTGDDGTFFNGSIDDVRVYRQVLSDEQISTMHNYGVNRIHSSMTIADDVWSATITPNDGTGDGLGLGSNTLTVLAANNLPTVDEYFLNSSRDGNLTNETLNCYVTVADTDAGDNLFVNYTLFKSGIINSTGQTAVNPNEVTIVANVTSVNTLVGEEWKCSARAYDERNYSTDTYNTSALTILNSVPSINSVRINASSGTNLTAENLTCFATVLDNDRVDSLLVNYSWYQDGVFHSAGQGAVTNNTETLLSTLQGNVTSDDEVWTCAMESWDSTDYGQRMNTSLTIIAASTTTTTTTPNVGGGGRLYEEEGEEVEEEEEEVVEESSSGIIVEEESEVEGVVEEVEEETEVLRQSPRSEEDKKELLVIVLSFSFGLGLLIVGILAVGMVMRRREIVVEDNWKKISNKIYEIGLAFDENNIEKMKNIYEEMKPIYSKLSYEEKKKVYPYLVKISNFLKNN